MNAVNEQSNPPPLPFAVLSEKYGGIPRSLFAVSIIIPAVLLCTKNPLVFIVACLIFMAFGFFRLKNMGRSGWLILLTFIPIVSLFVWLPCLYAPTGFAELEKLDMAGKIICGIILSITLLMIIGIALAGGIPFYFKN